MFLLFLIMQREGSALNLPRSQCYEGMQKQQWCSTRQAQIDLASSCLEAIDLECSLSLETVLSVQLILGAEPLILKVSWDPRVTISFKSISRCYIVVA
jgi:hypothetical protein